ncbi:hypothetical protein SAY86_014457 [Trapa natans]|uniref:Uncharacterized protein n=1 Tax=Trapa natans TaxID=22666 RepID=A0AAN7QN40_TRANT|nr:hypothetical protein SAY86_014457 [Trapa natans]
MGYSRKTEVKEAESVSRKNGLEINEARPDEKLPYREIDRHTCIALKDVYKLRNILENAEIPYTMGISGRAALFTRDPDANALEFVQIWLLSLAQSIADSSRFLDVGIQTNRPVTTRPTTFNQNYC